MTQNIGKGIIDTPSHHSVNETVEKLKEILQAKGITLFTLVDHSGEAAKIGMKMRPTKLLIFGNPKARDIRDARGAQQRDRPSAQAFSCQTAI